MKTSLIDLQAHLFAQLERLGDEDLSEDAVHLEINRSKAIAGIADRVINNAALVLQARKVAQGIAPSKSTDHLLALDTFEVGSKTNA